MTLKSYLRMLLAAVTLLFVTSGCNDDDNKVGPPPSYSFSVAVSDVAQTEATVTVTPSNDQATYYYAAVKKAEFDTFESDAAYAQHILDNLKAIADKKVLPLSEYLATALVKGSAPQKITDLTAGTDYYAVALGMLTDGRFTSDLVKEAFKTDDAPEAALELSITMTPGYNGEGTDTQMSVNFKASGRPAASGKYLLATTAAIDAVIAKGGSYDDIIDDDEIGYVFTAAELIELNSEEGTVGENWVWGRLTPGTSYTVIAKVKDADGNSVLKTAAESTAAAQGGEDGPEVHLTMKAGDSKGANKTTNITAIVQCSTAVSASYWLSTTAAVEKLLGEGQTYESLASPNKDGSNVFSADWIEKTKSEGGIALNYDKCNPGESWTMIVKVTDANGKSTIEHAAVTTETAQGGGDGPELTLTMKAGDHTGADPTTKITCLIKSSGVVSAKAGLWTKATIDDAIGKGMTIEQIINNEQNGEAIEDEYITGINGAGLNYTWGGASPATEYTAIIKVTDAAGNSTIKSATGATDAAGEATTVELKNLAQGEMQYWGDAYGIPENDYANWTIYLADATVDLSTFNGTGDVLMMELNTAKAVTTEITPGTYTVMPNRSKANFIAFSCVPGYVSGSSPYGTWYITENSAKNMLTSGTVVVAKSGDNYTFTIDLLDQSTNTTFKGSYTGAMNYVNATAQSAQMRTPWANAANAPKRLASVVDMQNIVDVEMTVSNSLSFEKKSAATYEATIGNVENIEKPLGLKKHFIKK